MARGAGTKQDWGLPPEAVDLVVDTTSLSGVVMQVRCAALASGASSSPSHSAPRTIRSRIGAARSPMPPVNTNASRPPNAAASEPKELWVVEEAAHGDVHQMAKEEYERRILDFFEKRLR